jgi:TonB family protein
MRMRRNAVAAWPRAVMLVACIAACAGCASGPPPRTARVDPDTAARRLGAPAVAPEDDCAREVLDNTFPQYPAGALHARTEGWVVLGFDLDGSGKAANIRVIGSQPPGVFEQSAITSVERTRYVAGARRVACRTRVTFAFKPRPS